MAKFDPAWIYQVEEPAIDAGRRIIDPHQHIWTERFALYVEHFGAASADDFLAGIARSGHNIVATVHLTIQADYRDDLPEAMKPVAETEYLEGLADDLARRSPPVPKLAAGIVAGADMLLGDAVEPVLEAHAAASPDRFRGIRHAVAWHPSPLVPFKEHRDGIVTEPAFIEAARCLAKRGLTLDLFVFYNQLPQIVALARAVPDLVIVLNHTGGPLHDPRFAEESEAILAEWRQGMEAVAACPNVVIKLGGINMLPLAGDRWTGQPKPPSSEQLAAFVGPYVRFAIDCFTPARAMFESNFPTERPSANYGLVWNGFKRISAGFSEHEKEQLFFSVARDTYRLAV